MNERLTLDGKEPIAFDHDCREGICGSCGMMINGVPHGPERGTATCQLHMRKFRDGDHVTIEPWRAASFPLVRDMIDWTTKHGFRGMALVELAPGVAPDEIAAKTEASYRVALA